MSIYGFHPRELPNYSSWAYFNEVFSPEECKKITDLMPASELRDATVSTKGAVDEKTRKTKVKWIGPDPEHNWIFDRLAQLTVSCNDARWGFDLSGFFEQIQLTHYNEGDFYNWHMDHGDHQFSKRKLSLVVQLTDPKEYEGGELEFFSNGEAMRDQGTLVLFPSYLYHRVKPVTKGTRKSLVAWVSGQPYR